MILEARDVTVFYGDVCALAGVSLAVRDGEFLSIIGPNGAGKSTLIRLMSGELPPNSGVVVCDGENRGAPLPWRPRVENAP
jgi:ABC-type multidrug transport system ATPase subunit